MSEVKEVMHTPQPSLFDDEALAGITSFSDALALVKDSGLEAIDASELGTGFSILPDRDKSRLVGVPLIVLDWRFNQGNYGEFVSLYVVTEFGGKYIVNDGSTGLCADLRRLTKKLGGEKRPIAVRKGLTRSDYTHRDADGNETPATTYYMSLEK